MIYCLRIWYWWGEPLLLVSPFWPGTTSCLCCTLSASCSGRSPEEKKHQSVQMFVEIWDMGIIALQNKQADGLTAGLRGSSGSCGGYTFRFLLSQFFDSSKVLVWRHESCWGPPPRTGNLDRHLGKGVKRHDIAYVCYTSSDTHDQQIIHNNTR